MHIRLLLVSFLVLLLSSLGSAQLVTTIADVQDTTGGAGGGASHLDGQVVTVNGVISGESWAFGSYYIQDGSGPWSGVYVYGDFDRNNAYGDSVQITATVTEYNGLTELTNVTSYIKLDSGKTVMPTVVTTGEIGTGGSNAEAYEGVLVTVQNAAITNPALGYGEWEINDGSGPCRVDDAADYYFNPANYDSVISVTGVLAYTYGDTKIQPRLAWDVIEGGGFTRVQRIQQVRTSDLLKAPIDQMSDMSYAADPTNAAGSYRGDTVTVKGVVTMPTGLSYAGAGIKFIFSEPEGGPWSGILSYHPDSSSYPVLYEGDVIEVTGDIGEYRTGPSNMTEFWILSQINIVGIGEPIPDPDFVNTGDLRLPVTAEQWGNVMVYVKDAEVVNVSPQYELFEIDDGTGSVLVDDDSDSLNNYPDPPLGSFADSIRGWLYHHYGSYVDSSAYKLEPLYTTDLVWGGGGPPLIENCLRDVVVPSSSDVVTISADVTSNLTLTDVSLYYRVDGGSYVTVPMSQSHGDTYEGQIPAQSLGSWVDYYVMATDDQSQVSSVPAITSTQNLCYPVTNGMLTGIKDIQYTPWEIADSPYEGYSIEITGVVTNDTAANNRYMAYSIQDDESPWSGVFAFNTNTNLNRGDEITVYGTVTDYNDDYHFKWDNNTVILTDSIKVLSSGNTVKSISLTTGELANGSTTAESYEGVLVNIQGATLMNVNSYDVTFDDGSGGCLVDGDFMLARDQDPNNTFYVNDDDQYLVAFGDTIYPGEVVDAIQGVFTWSFGSHKIEIRDVNDFGPVVGVDPDFEAMPLSYKLNQNFPNPFNPETRIYFEIPRSHDVKIIIYNVLGQQVRTLVKENFNAGRHIVNWDGKDNAGNLVSTGVYFYRIQAGDFIASKKMLMMQ